QSAKEISQKYNCDVILKGKNTVVNVNDEQYICSIGGPELASAGTGDVLAGLLSSLLGQGLNNLRASMYAVALHAQAGVNLKKKYCESGITATALIGEIRGILK
ncbi:MAG: NAD(P)H-hydrate dehydratase, partial [Gammaproteobacteria bacterium]